MKQIQFFIIIILGLLLSGVAGSSETQWKKGEHFSKVVGLNNMRFTNRARCALDSKKPTQSAFVMVTNIDAARSLYRLAKATNQDSSTVVKKGIRRFRYSVVQLLELIHRRLMNRELPLLSSNSTENHVPRKYKKLMESCRSDEYCDELDQYIQKIWKISSNDSLNNIEKVLKYYDVDNYHSKESFLDPKDFEDKKVNTKLSCHYLKKFSPLQAHLYGTKPNKKAMTQIAEAAYKSDEMLARCDDFDSQENLKVAGYQIEFTGLKDKKWNEQGFDYWNSLKLYFSWAWRNAPEMEQIAFPFGEVFPAIAIEEAVMLVPNGCKSITVPECDGDYLALNAMREFAKKDMRKKKITLDVLSELPEGPQQDLLDDTFTDVNNDILDLVKQPDASAWINNFQTNLSGTRSLMKNKLIKAVTFLDIAKANLNKKKLIKKLNQQFSIFKTAEGRSSVENTDLKNELFYLCAEFNFSHHKDFSFLRGNLDILSKTTLIDGITKGLSKNSTKAYFEYYTEIAEAITTQCSSLEQREIWNDEFELEKQGYSSWYIEKIYEDKYKSTLEIKAKEYLAIAKPELAYGQYSESKDFNDVLCASPAHCARKVLGSIVDLFSTSQYANTFYSLDQALKSPALFNPYAERTSCKIYDPWYKSRAIIFNLFADLGQAALSLTTPGAIYSSFNLKPGRVVSFRQLVEEGKIEYDTRMDSGGVQASLVADFGPLLGVPCAISYMPTSNPYNTYRFAGISAAACTSSSDNDLVVRNASDYDDNQTTNRSGCASCALNFESVATSATRLAPTVGTTFFLVKAIIRLYKGLKDPFNIPRSWEANPNYVLDSYKKFGEIPKKCVRSLRKGKMCLRNDCEENVLKALYDKADVSVKSFRQDNGNAYLKVHNCEEEIVVDVTNSPFGDSCRVKKIVIPESCKHLIKGKK
ncbi:MAG: hypothetical protein ACJAT2_001200 [Bacteriovoracaceae bacterium]|jgi:hypothetical protein